MLKLVPKYQKGKSVWTPQQMQQAIDKKYPQYARVRDNDLKKPLSSTDPVGRAYIKAVAYGLPIARGALTFSKIINDTNRANAQANYRAARKAKFSPEQARQYAGSGDPDSWITAPFSWLVDKYYRIQAKHPIINAILP